MKTYETSVVVTNARLSYAHLFEPYSGFDTQDPSFSATLLIPKSDVELKAKIDAAIEAARQKGIEGAWNGACPQALRTPIKDGDGTKEKSGEPYGPECKGHWILQVKSSVSHPPEIVDERTQPILDRSKIYSGCYVNVFVNFFPWNNPVGGKGISAGFGPVQKAKDGEPLGGAAPKASSVFSSIQSTAQPMAQQINPLTGLPF